MEMMEMFCLLREYNMRNENGTGGRIKSTTMLRKTNFHKLIYKFINVKRFFESSH